VSWSSRIAARARRELAQADPARLSKVFEQLRGLPGPRRTFEALHAALGGVGVTSGAGGPGTTRHERPTGAKHLLGGARAATEPTRPAGDDGLTCYERGSHAPGCPHRPLDGSGVA